MVSKQLKRTCSTRPFLSFILLITIFNTANAQNISKYFTSSMQDDGNLYFIEPKQEFKNKEDGNSKLLYDLTYLTRNDSITLNFTYHNNEIRKIDSLSFTQKNLKTSAATNKIFIESKKNVWKHRYSAKFLFNDLYFLFKKNKKTSMLIHYNGKSTRLETSKRKWNKQAEILSKIMIMIKANKKNP